MRPANLARSAAFFQARVNRLRTPGDRWRAGFTPSPIAPPRSPFLCWGSSMAEPPESPDPRRAVRRRRPPRPGVAIVLVAAVAVAVGGATVGAGLAVLAVLGVGGVLWTALLLGIVALGLAGAFFVWRVATAAGDFSRRAEVDGTSLRGEPPADQDPWA